MIKFLKNLPSWRRVKAKDINAIIDYLNRTGRVRVRGAGVRQSDGPHGTNVTINTPRTGGTLRLAKTQETAQADGNISVRLADASGATTGTSFDALAIFTDGATATNTCLPRLAATNKSVLVSNVLGTWYIVNPTFTDSEACT